MTLAQTDQAGRERAAPAVDRSGHAKVVLTSQAGGHFFGDGSINGSPISFAVDTGASRVSISVADARRMGINYLKGQKAWSNTANGRAATYLLKFDQVQLGDIVLHNIDGAVLEDPGPPVALLGMSFLNRMDIQRDGKTMTLTKRF